MDILKGTIANGWPWQKTLKEMDKTEYWESESQLCDGLCTLSLNTMQHVKVENQNNTEKQLYFHVQFYSQKQCL